MSVFENLGGHEAVKEAVEIFYKKVLNDDRVSYLFETIDMDYQLAKQTAFLTTALGGPNSYTGKDMREAHKYMRLTDTHFDAVTENLQATLEQMNKNKEDIEQVLHFMSSVKNDVLNR